MSSLITERNFKESHTKKFFLFTDLRQLSDGAHPFQRFTGTTPNGGLFPKPFNIAMKAKISANATCGGEDEEFCRMADIYSPR
jgi:hypothetical protein